MPPQGSCPPNKTTTSSGTILPSDQAESTSAWPFTLDKGPVLSPTSTPVWLRRQLQGGSGERAEIKDL